MKSGLFTVFQYNGKDLFLQAPDESFTVLSFSELPHEVREQLCVDREQGNAGRQVEITPAGAVVLIKTAKEIEIERDKKQRHAKILAEIAGLESSGDLPEYALKRLERLRKELVEHEGYDPTATTLDQKRANASCS